MLYEEVRRMLELENKLESTSSQYLNVEQKEAKEAILGSNGNFFVTGKGGTGKTMLLNSICNSDPLGTVVMAPTGMAALLIGGKTHFSALGINPYNLFEQKVVSRETRNFFERKRRILIDEVSMVPSVGMQAIDIRMREIRNRDVAFGGLQVVAFGDLHQLPPVIVKPEDEDYLQKRYGTKFFYGADACRKRPFRTVELKQVFRQTDQEYLEIVNSVRDGTLTKEQLDILNSRVVSQAPEGVVQLTARKETARIMNEKKLRELPGREQTYMADIYGEYPENLYPTEAKLVLKVGAFVMMVQNDGDKRWVNGTLGYIKELKEEEIVVSIKDKNSGQEKIYSVNRTSWPYYENVYSDAACKTNNLPDAVFKQFPIKLAYAITTHKAQGQTLDNVLLDYGSGAFCEGLLYVGLTRVRCLADLYLKKALTLEDVRISQEIFQLENDLSGYGMAPRNRPGLLNWRKMAKVV